MPNQTWSLPTSVRWLRRLVLLHPSLLGASVGLLLAWPVPDGSVPLGGDQRLVWSLAAIAAAVLFMGGDRLRRASVLGLPLAILGLVALSAGAIVQRLDEPAVGLVVTIAAILGVLDTGASPERTLPPQTRLMLQVASALVVALMPAWTPLSAGLTLPVLILCGIVLLALPAEYDGAGADDLLDQILLSPARLLVASFGALGLFGALLLALPIADAQGHGIGILDALFTAVSATCVTGLIVLDTPVDFSLFGQGVILFLIELGGLGIMTFAAVASVYLGRRLGVREEAIAAELVGGAGARQDLERVLGRVLQVTLWTEGLGALALFGLFLLHGDTVGQAAWRGLFTSISAFCNAGFALQSDSLMPYQHDPLVLGVTSLIILIGGLGPLVVIALPTLLRGRGRLHGQLVLVATAVLVVVPAVLYLALEWNDTLGGLGLLDKASNAWFQSITLRTAGFNSVDLSLIRPATWTVLIVTMFIGGSPGSTAGGAKTTTIVVLLVAAQAAVRRRLEATIFGRRIERKVVYEAIAIVVVGLGSALLGLMALQVTQDIPLDQGIFEVVSALATVGLSMGATAQLDSVGKIVIIACMFAGRVGPLSIVALLADRPETERRYPVDSVQVG